MNMRDAYRMLGIVALILVIAFALQLATLPPAGIALVLVVVAVVFAALFASRRRARAQRGQTRPGPPWPAGAGRLMPCPLLTSYPTRTRHK